MASRKGSKGAKRKSEALIREDIVDEVPITKSARPELGRFHPNVRDPTNIDKIREDMEVSGFAVVGNILNESEKAEFEHKFWDALCCRVPSIDRHDQTTWTEENVIWKGAYGAGQFKYYGMAQEEHCWMIRKNKSIQGIFESLFNEECCVSLDGAAALFSPCVSKLQMHVDLVPDVDGYDFGSIQGSYNLFGVEESGDKVGASFVCVPGSHRLYDEMWAARKANADYVAPSKHWYVLESDSPLQHQGQIIVSPPNCLILWDSKLLHKNYGGDFTCAELGGRPCRMTQFVAWQPKRVRTQAVLKKKRENVLLGKSGNHWAATAVTEPIKPFPAWGKHPVKVVIPFAGLKEVPADIEAIL